MPSSDTLHAQGHEFALDVGRGFFVPSMNDLLADKKRNFDISGKDVGAVYQKTGWGYIARPLFVAARTPGSDQAVAVGWCTLIQWNDSKALGVNLSFATAPGWERLGLASALCFRAFNRLAEHAPEGSLGAEVNIQCFRKNVNCIGLASRLGFQRKESRDFKVEQLQRTYLAFSMETDLFKSMAEMHQANSLDPSIDCCANG